ncbi:hypothetical protein [Streptomyces sp. NPDC057854]
MAPPSPGKQPASARRKKNSQPTQRSPQQRVKVVGADGKVTWIWRPWPTK